MNLKDARAGVQLSAATLRMIGQKLDMIPSQQMDSLFDTGWFPAKITGTVTGGYTFKEQCIDSTGTVVDKPSGLTNNANDPAVSLTGDTLATGDIVLMRRSVGAGGTKWEARNSISGSGTDKHATRWNGTNAVQDSLVVIDDNGGITSPFLIRATDPGGTYIVEMQGTSGGPFISFIWPTIGPVAEFLGHSDRLLCYAINGRFELHTNADAAAAKYAIHDGTTAHDGVSGTLGDGSTVTGGIITALGGGGTGTIDGGTW